MAPACRDKQTVQACMCKSPDPGTFVLMDVSPVRASNEVSEVSGSWPVRSAGTLLHCRLLELRSLKLVFKCCAEWLRLLDIGRLLGASTACLQHSRQPLV